jgi:hypothetical protein
MTSTSTKARAALRGMAMAGVLFSAAMLLLTAGGIVPGLPLFDTSGVDAATAGTAPVGPFTVSPASGNSDQLRAVGPSPLPATCPGDSANDGFRVDSFMTPVANDPATLTYNAAGPVGSGFTQPLFDRNGTPVVARNTAPDTGLILTIPSINFSVFGPGTIPAGQYFIGIACTKLGETESFWSSTVEVTVDGANGGTSEVQVALVAAPPPSSTTTTTTVADSTTTTSVDGGTTTTTVSGGTTTTTDVAGTTTSTVAGGSTNATVTPASPTPGGSYSVGFPSCQVGETITFSQPESTPASVTDVCEASSALTSGSVAGLRMPAQAATGTATGNFTAAPTAPGSYTVTMTGTVSAQRTTTFVIVGASTPVTGGNTGANTTGSSTGSSGGSIPSTGSSTTSLIVWAVLLLVFGRMAILLGRKPKVLTGI